VESGTAPETQYDSERGSKMPIEKRAKYEYARSTKSIIQSENGFVDMLRCLVS
jgi:hypothetical protein